MNSKDKFQKYLPIFKEKYSFEVCPKDRVDELTAFIDRYWKKDHIFVKSRELLDWNFYDAERDRYNFCIATEKSTGEIHAMVGFTYTSHFDPDIKTPVSWGCLWKAREDVAEPGLGLMVEWMKDFQFESCAEVGLGESDKAIRLAKKNGAHTGIMDQYYLINDEINDLKLISGMRKRPQTEDNGSFRDFREIGEKDLVDLKDSLLSEIPCFKSSVYYVNRYFRHPIYSYHMDLILNATGEELGAFVWRECSALGSKCLRIVDYFGCPGALAGTRSAFQKLLREREAEYIDMMCVGMPEEQMKQAGFEERHRHKDIIIPNYFEPFLQQNTDIAYSWKGVPEAGIIFKGDSDQDRPSLIEKN